MLITEQQPKILVCKTYSYAYEHTVLKFLPCQHVFAFSMISIFIVYICKYQYNLIEQSYTGENTLMEQLYTLIKQSS